MPRHVWYQKKIDQKRSEGTKRYNAVKAIGIIMLLVVGCFGIPLLFNALFRFSDFKTNVNSGFKIGTSSQLVTLLFFALNSLLISRYFRDIQRKLEDYINNEISTGNHSINDQHKDIHPFKRLFTYNNHSNELYSNMFFKKIQTLLLFSFFELTVCYIWDLCLGLLYCENSSLFVSCLSTTIPLITVFIVASCFLVGKNDEQLNKMLQANINNWISQALITGFDDVVYASVDYRNFLVRANCVFPLNIVRESCPQCSHIQLDSIKIEKDSNAWRLNSEDINIPMKVYTYFYESENANTLIDKELDEVYLIYTYKWADDSLERRLLVNIKLNQQ